ncbi:hypothetical protein AKJ16_DCAP11222 [Drosera capensis]
MKVLCRKLYNKYTNLKAKKDSELEQVNRDQEVKFINWTSRGKLGIDWRAIHQPHLYKMSTQ